jgi:hypothetical protein
MPIDFTLTLEQRQLRLTSGKFALATLGQVAGATARVAAPKNTSQPHAHRTSS